MQKIDLQEDILSSFEKNLDSFQLEVQGVPNNTNAGGLGNYKNADLQIVFASVLPYSIVNNGGNSMLQFDMKKIIEGWRLYEQLRVKNNIHLILDGDSMSSTTHVDFKLNFLYHLKGTDGLNSVDDFKKLKNAGFRSIQFVREFDNKFASCFRNTTSGLTELGKDVLEYLENNKMIIDTANMNYKSMIETYQFTKKPIINSHCNVFSLYNHNRNVTDDFLNLIQRSEGLIGLSFNSEFIVPNNEIATIDNYLQQIEYVKGKVGDDHVALGTGYHNPFYKKLIQGLENISFLKKLEEKMIEKFGYKFTGKFFWDNSYRFLIQTI